METLRFDRIGYWTELKLEIIQRYASEYSKILANQTSPKLFHVYIDAFAGAGQHISLDSGEIVPGSPLIALSIAPPFRQYYFIDLNRSRTDHLLSLTRSRSDVSIEYGDCNEVLVTKVFPKVKFEDYRRGLCLLDPYGLDLNWNIIETAGKMRSLDIFLNFPVMDMNRNVLWRCGSQIPEQGIRRMNAFWGDDSWQRLTYVEQCDLFGATEYVKSLTNLSVANAFKKRLHDVAEFSEVLDPIPMRNSIGRVIYYLFFASQKPVAAEIVDHIFRKYERHGYS